MSTRKTKKKNRERKFRSAREYAKKQEGGADLSTLTLPEGVNLLKLDKPGNYRLDILPYEVGAGNPNAEEGEYHFERTYFAHRVGEEGNAKMFVCPAKTANQKCPICEALRKERSKSSPDDDLIKALAPKKRQLMALIDRAEPDKGIQLLDYSFHGFGKFLVAELDADDEDEFGLFYSPTEGLTVKVRFAPSEFSQKWLQSSSINFVPRKKQYEEDIIDEVPVLDNLIKIESYKTLAAALMGGEDKDEGADDEDEDDVPMNYDDDDGEDEKPAKKPKKKAPAKKPKKKPEPEPEDEDDDDEGWDDDDSDEDSDDDSDVDGDEDSDDADDDSDSDDDGWDDGDEEIEEDETDASDDEADDDDDSADDDGWDDDGWDDGDEDEDPAPKKPTKKPAKKPAPKKAPAKKKATRTRR